MVRKTLGILFRKVIQSVVKIEPKAWETAKMERHVLYTHLNPYNNEIVHSALWVVELFTSHFAIATRIHSATS